MPAITNLNTTGAPKKKKRKRGVFVFFFFFGEKKKKEKNIMALGGYSRLTMCGKE